MLMICQFIAVAGAGLAWAAGAQPAVARAPGASAVSAAVAAIPAAAPPAEPGSDPGLEPEPPQPPATPSPPPAPRPVPPGVNVPPQTTWEPAPRPPFADGLVLNVPAFSLRLYQGGRLVREHRIAVGRPPTPTPCGDFFVMCKVRTPSWYPPGGGDPVPPGPANPLGNWWLGLSADRYGIHGTNDPFSIGHAVSMGCVRLADAEAGELFNRVAVGYPVSIVYRPIEAWRCLETGERVLALHGDIYGRATGTVAAAELDASMLAAGLNPAACAVRGDLLAAFGRGARTSVSLGVPVRFNGLYLAAGMAAPAGDPVWAALGATTSAVAAAAVAPPLALVPPAVARMLIPLRPLAAAIGEVPAWNEAAGRAVVRGVEVGDAIVDGRCYVRPAALDLLGLRWAWDDAGGALDISLLQVEVRGTGRGEVGWPGPAAAVTGGAFIRGAGVLAGLLPLAAAIGVDASWDGTTTGLVAGATVPVVAVNGTAYVTLDDLAAALPGLTWAWQPGSPAVYVWPPPA